MTQLEPGLKLVLEKELGITIPEWSSKKEKYSWLGQQPAEVRNKFNRIVRQEAARRQWNLTPTSIDKIVEGPSVEKVVPVIEIPLRPVVVSLDPPNPGDGTAAGAVFRGGASPAIRVHPEDQETVHVGAIAPRTLNPYHKWRLAGVSDTRTDKLSIVDAAKTAGNK